ncbi:winged helix-turn-helix domain-containing protein [Lysobacter solisilvae (ex Woo and Kim 2022)]|uniref:PD40 domain-containing protein n=1 Tax=Agrilutibacter terrestris TaxID=2865112 RepID=A0A7H0FZR6_9GAMM|nr:winged helix-turn-helix domain-containing protein [Lysobacter terrestris]QNP41532.1 PD40 domain-containing protein [Lysobacter terrestris]
MSISSPPPPSLLSARLRVGECTVDMSLREIHAPGARRARRVTPKAIGVLAALIEHGGRVVSREALLAQVWAGTMPTDDVVTQAITQLRKGFDDERGNPHYIETIAKYGYRLLASVESLDDAGAMPDAAAHPLEGAVATEPARARYAPAPVDIRGDWRGILAAVVAVGLLFGLVLLWSFRRDEPVASRHAAAASARPAATASYRLITSVPGIESSPSLSPDAALVAYVATPTGGRGSAIMLQTTDPSTPRQLSHPEGDAWDSAPAWSPNGREIAFLRVEPGRACRVMVLPSNGGTERSVGECDPRNPPSFDWTFDGRGLVFGSRGTPTGGVGLRLLDLASGEWRLLDYGATAADVDFAPHYSPDGRWIVFVRNTPVGDLYRIPSTGGTAQRLTRLHADIRGWDWMPDGRSIVLSRWSGSESRLLQVDLDSGLTQDMGIPDAIEPTIAARVPAMAFSESRSFFGIHHVALDGKGGIDRMYPSSGRDRLPVIAPDARQMVFTSDRSGEFGLWWAQLDRPESLRLVNGLRPESWHPPDWSQDSRRLLVVGDGETGFGLYEVTPASGQVVRLPSPMSDVVQALYLPGDDARVLVVAGGEEGRLQLQLFNRRTRPWQRLAVIPDVAVARVDGAGRRVLFTRPGRPGLWAADLALSPASVRQIDPQVPEVARYRAWAVASDGRIYYFERQPGCASALRRLGDPKTLLCVDRNRRNGPSGFSLAPRNDAIYVTLSLWDGGDIGFMPLAMAPEPVGSQ